MGGIVKLIFVWLVLFFIFTSCSLSTQQPVPSSSPPPSDPWDLIAKANVNRLLTQDTTHRYSPEEIEHLQWVAKASLLLRGKTELSLQKDKIAELKSMSKEQVVDLFLSSDLFYNTVADFSLYFSGFRIDPFYMADQSLSPRIFEFPNALTAAASVEKDQSFFNFLAEAHPKYVAPLRSVVNDVFKTFEIPEPTKEIDTSQKKRSYFFSEAAKKLRNLSQLTDDELMLASHKTCSFLSGFESFSYTNSYSFYTLGISSGLEESLVEKYPSSPSSYSFCFYEYSQETQTGEYKIVNLTDAKDKITRLIAYLDIAPTLIADFEVDIYKVNKITDVKFLDTAKFGKKLIYQNPQIAFRLLNSSTNMNRRRGAYILKHYFCDDLTPINVKVSGDHAQGAHGSNPSCYACHYKLDPMAGFFKTYGDSFTDYSKSTTITFDDFAKTDTTEYQKQWLKPDGKSWNIGYIQSTQYEHLNQYGETLGDLHKILQTSPDVKRCMVKRVFEYSTTPEQIFDPGYIDEMAQIFSQEETASPQKAMKNLFKRVALSKTFTKNNAISSECYDAKTGTGTASRPPCQIAHILETNCVKCHKSATGKTSLDLSTWIATSDGTMGFPHIDKATGLQRPSSETFKTMLERITSSDEFERMPPGDMNPVYRQMLFQWLSEK